jgi:hypothetical protein
MKISCSVYFFEMEKYEVKALIVYISLRQKYEVKALIVYISLRQRNMR